MITHEFESFLQNQDATLGVVLKKLIEQEWERVLREISALDIDSGDVIAAATLIGHYQILDKLMAALSEGSLGSDYEIEAQWRSQLIQHVVEGFKLNVKISTPPPRYRSLAQQVAAACGLEVIEN